MSEIIRDHIALKQVSSKVLSVSEAKPVIAKLENTLRKYPNGIGLSAIQIGIPIRISVIKYGNHDVEFIHLINPEFVKKEEPFKFIGEGCLSFPDIYVETERHKDFVITNDVIDGDEFRRETLAFTYTDDNSKDALESIAVEHEMDHLEGRTILDYGKPIKPPNPIVRDKPKVSRNDPCPCGSGLKYKKCCGR